tara:strand:- start:462 stop:1310 length:849 start_codon:yes stop_codon:yes gene_type:complete
MKNLFFLILFSLEIFSQNKPLISIYLDDNNITIKCENAEIGDKKKINGKIYTVVNKSILVNMIKKENDVSCLCISKVKDLTGVIGNYYGIETNFNQDISSWDTSNVINMTGLFGQASKFNQDISYWDTSNVRSMENMFLGAISFNQNIGGWDTASVTSMSGMFNGAISFNQDISGWDTSSVVNMESMFDSASRFNQNISNWDTSSVKNMCRIFNGATKFNQDISGWNTKNVSNMDKMIRGASEFKIDLSRLCVESIITTPDQFTTETTNYPKEYIPKWGTCP